MADHDTWHWQEPGTAWKGAGLYHITLTIPSREPLLGELRIPDNDLKQAHSSLVWYATDGHTLAFWVQKYYNFGTYAIF